jgi:hypothetical protein
MEGTKYLLWSKHLPLTSKLTLVEQMSLYMYTTCRTSANKATTTAHCRQGWAIVFSRLHLISGIQCNLLISLCLQQKTPLYVSWIFLHASTRKHTHIKPIYSLIIYNTDTNLPCFSTSSSEVRRIVFHMGHARRAARGTTLKSTTLAWH